MTWQVWVIVGLAAVVLLVTGYAFALRRRLTRTSTEVVADAGAAGVQTPAPPVRPEPEFVITSVGQDVEETPATRDRRSVPDAVVLSATLGEPLVKVVSFAHGVRRALSPANRNKIGFEVRQEVRRSRKVRRQEMRVAWRRMKADERARERAGAPEAPDDDALEGLGETA